jgi:TolA-binding protein
LELSPHNEDLVDPSIPETDATAATEPAATPGGIQLDMAPNQATSASPGNQALPAVREDDFKFPNPEVEPNTVLLQNFREAVRLGREGRHAEAAARFQSYATNHPLSGLTPRALYLAASLHPDLGQAAAAAQQLTRQHASSVYIRMLRSRRPEVFEVVPSALPMTVQPTPTPVSVNNLPPAGGDETAPAAPEGMAMVESVDPMNRPSQRISPGATPITISIPPDSTRTPRPTPVGAVVEFSTLSPLPPGSVAVTGTTGTVVIPPTTVPAGSGTKAAAGAASGGGTGGSRAFTIPSTELGPTLPETELVAALNTPREPGVRIQVARGLIRAQQAKRALEILAPAEQQVKGTLNHAEVLALQAEAYIALGDNANASSTLTTLVQNFPESAAQPRIRLQLGLLSEEAGVIPRARSYYRAIVEDTPTSPEAKLAQQRLDDLKGL